MKRVVFLCTFLILTAAHSWLAGQPAGSLQGTWELILSRQIQPDGSVVEITPSDRQALKIVGRGHFIYISQDGPGTFHGAHGGRYQVEGDTYIERMDFASLDRMRGRSYRFQYRLEGDRWHLRGRFGELRLEEMWQRVE